MPDDSRDTLISPTNFTTRMPVRWEPPDGWPPKLRGYFYGVLVGTIRYVDGGWSVHWDAVARREQQCSTLVAAKALIERQADEMEQW